MSPQSTQGIGLAEKAHETASRKPYLVHPKVDWFLLGGGSLIFTLWAWLFKIPAEGWFLSGPTLLFVFSYPHFMASYYVFYGPGGSWRRHRGVAVVFPAVFAATLAVAASVQSWAVIETVGQLSLVLLYWHFLKQAYGVALWSGSAPSRSLKKGQKDLLLICLLLFGCYGYIGYEHSDGFSYVFYMKLTRWDLVDWPLICSRWMAYGSLATFVAWIARDTVREARIVFSWQGWLPVAALICWFEPALSGSPARMILPVFHGLQYFPFPYRVILSDQISARVRTPVLLWVRPFCVFLLILAAGALCFEWGPRWVAPLIHGSASLRVFAMATLFFNVHHYFIDSVIWRFGDPEVRKRLSGAS